MTIIVGVNAYHGDASACLVKDGKLVAAAEEERFRRIKHRAGFPSEAIRYVLLEAGARLEDITHLAINSNPDANRIRRIGFVLRHRPDFRFVIDRLKNQKKRTAVTDELAEAFPDETFKGSVEHVEHHLAHLASAFLVSPFEEAVTISVDGFGDFSSAAWGTGCGTAIEIVSRVWFPHSLGVFYQAMTQYLGFPHYGDEYKVMGLAPYGQPHHVDKMRQIVKLSHDGAFELDLGYFRHHREKIDYAWDGGSPHVGTLFSPSLEDLLGPARGRDDPLSDYHRDIARSVQAMYEEAFFNLLAATREKFGLDTLTLAGGCAMNSVANGKVIRQSPYKRLYVQSAAGDAGGAIGAAMQVWYSLKVASVRRNNGAMTSTLVGDAVHRPFVMDHAYYGPGVDEAEVEALPASRSGEITEIGCSVRCIEVEHELCHEVAAAVAEGLVIGWFQGRMEWGPRALGNRSIVCDPRRADMKDILNLKIKRRESFRPFAPSIQKEYVAEWFEEDGDVPFMMQVYQIRPERRETIPAVTHVDGSGRLQTVYKDTNPRYWKLIDAYRDLTGVPMVLNTSFNENEPVVCRPVEALDCFLRTQMDMLVLGNWVVRRLS